MDEKQIEQAIAEKSLSGPRITPARIDETIAAEDYHVFTGGRLTVCALTLKNGFIVTGESSCVSAKNFDPELGRKISRDAAREKIWELEGYLLREKLWQETPR